MTHSEENRLTDLVQGSTIHGISHIYSTRNKISKAFWVLLFICGISGIIINAIYILLKYVSIPIQLNHLLENERFQWPHLTFCNPTAPFYLKENSDAYNHWKQVLNHSKEIVKLLIDETQFFKLIHNNKKSNMELEERTVAMSTVDPYKLDAQKFQNHFVEFSYTTVHEGIYISREYDSNNPHEINVNLSTAFSTHLVQIGNNIPCYTLEMEKIKSLNLDSVKSFILRLRFNYDSYKIFNSSYIYRSVFLYIANGKEMPRENEIILYPGHNNILKISQTRYIYDNLKRRCRDDVFKVTLYDALLQSTKEYEGSYEDCKRIVSQELYFENCKCFNPLLPIYKSGEGFPRLCFNATFFSDSEIIENARCLVRIYNKYAIVEEFDAVFNSKCEKYKYSKCNFLSYQIIPSKEMFIAIWSNTFNDRRNLYLHRYFKHYFPNETIDKHFIQKIRDNILKITIIRTNEFSDLYEQQRSYRFSDLLSDIGGLMGLWLGMSIVGLFEILEFFFLILKTPWKIKKNKQDKTVNINDNEHETVHLS